MKYRELSSSYTPTGVPLQREIDDFDAYRHVPNPMPPGLGPGPGVFTAAWGSVISRTNAALDTNTHQVLGASHYVDI